MIFAKFLRAPCFTENLQWLLLKVSNFQPATWLKKRHRKRFFSVNFAKFLRKSFLLTKHLRMTASCVYLWILRNSTSRKLLFYVLVAELQPADTVKKYFTGQGRIQGVDQGYWYSPPPSRKIWFLKLSWEPSFYPEFCLTFVIITLHFLISISFPFLITIARWSF